MAVCLVWVLFRFLSFVFALKLLTVHLLFVGVIQYAVKTEAGKELVPWNVLFYCFLLLYFHASASFDSSTEQYIA